MRGRGPVRSQRGTIVTLTPGSSGTSDRDSYVGQKKDEHRRRPVAPQVGERGDETDVPGVPEQEDRRLPMVAEDTSDVQTSVLDTTTLLSD